MKTMKRNKWLLMIAVMVCASKGYAQTIDDGIKALSNQNYHTARSIFKALVAQQPTNSAAFYDLGQAYSFLGVNDSARSAYQQGLTANPKDYSNLIGLGKTYLQQNNTADAQKYFDQAKAIASSKDANYYVKMAEAYLHNDHANTQQALNFLQQALNITSKNADVYLLMGEALDKSGQYGDAMTNLEIAVKYTSNPAIAYDKQGVLWTDAKNYDQSLAAFQNAIKSDSTFAPTYRDLAALYDFTGQDQKAIDSYRKYLKYSENSPSNQYTLMVYEFKAKDYQDVATVVEQLKNTSAATHVLYRLGGYSNYELGNYAVAKDYMDQFFQKADTAKILPSDNLYYAKALSKTNNDSLAIIYFIKAVKQDTTKQGKEDEYDALSQLYYGMKKYDLSAEDLQNKINLESNPQVQDYFYMGRALYFDSAYKKADSSFQKITTITPDWPIAYQWMARSKLAADTDSVRFRAIDDYLQAINLSMKDSVKYQSVLKEAYKTLGSLYLIRGDYTNSLLYLNKYLSVVPDDDEIQKLIAKITAYLKAPHPAPKH
jgi:tetratricopeptide (TPR) repeat protein